MSLHKITLVSTCLAALALSSCGGPGSEATGATPGSGEPSVSAAASQTVAANPGAAVTFQDPWVMASSSAMTALYGVLRNTGSSTVTVQSATTSASRRAELHETVMDGAAKTMRPKAGGFTILPGGEHELKPGGDHIMVMGLTGPVRAGDLVKVTLTLSDGTTVTAQALGKQTRGGHEDYQPTDAATTMSPGTAER